MALNGTVAGSEDLAMLLSRPLTQDLQLIILTDLLAAHVVVLDGRCLFRESQR